MSHNIYVNWVACTFQYLLFNNSWEADVWVTAKISEVRDPIATELAEMAEDAKIGILWPEHFRNTTADNWKTVVEIVSEVVWQYLNDEDKTKLILVTGLSEEWFDIQDFVYHL